MDGGSQNTSGPYGGDVAQRPTLETVGRIVIQMYKPAYFSADGFREITGSHGLGGLEAELVGDKEMLDRFQEGSGFAMHHLAKPEVDMIMLQLYTTWIMYKGVQGHFPNMEASSPEEWFDTQVERYVIKGGTFQFNRRIDPNEEITARMDVTALEERGRNGNYHLEFTYTITGHESGNTHTGSYCMVILKEDLKQN